MSTDTEIAISENLFARCIHDAVLRGVSLYQIAVECGQPIEVVQHVYLYVRPSTMEEALAETGRDAAKFGNCPSMP